MHPPLLGSFLSHYLQFDHGHIHKDNHQDGKRPYTQEEEPSHCEPRFSLIAAMQADYYCPLHDSKVAADLYLADLAKPEGKGTAIWSTHKPSGFLFSASSGPQPFTYEAGVGGVVTGWEDGVMSMQLGEKSKLEIPWKFAYGAAGHPGFKIPGQADLVFEIEVLDISA